MALESLHALYIEQLQDLYSAETQIIDALPKMAEASNNADLKQGFKDHLAQTMEHARRLEMILDRHGVDRNGQKCKGMEGLLKEGDEMVKKHAADPNTKDAGLIASAQRVEHYEIAGYGTVCTFAEEMGHWEDLQLLKQTIAEEKQTDQKLTMLAESRINTKADGGQGKYQK